MKLFLFGLFFVLGLTWVSEALAFVPSGGSRLLYYYTKRSFAAGAGDNSAETLIQIVNSATATGLRIGVKYYKGDDCQETSTIFRDIAAGQSITINVADETPGTFQAGVAEIYFVNGSNVPIRADAGVGSSIIIDLPMNSLMRLAAAKLHSDDRVDFNTPIAAAGGPTTFAPLILAGRFELASIVTTKMVLFAPGTDSGSVAADRSLNVAFRRPNGTDAGSDPLDIGCGNLVTLPTVRGQTPAQFQASFPEGGVVAPSVEGQPKGVVGWVFETIQLPGPANFLFGSLLQSFGVQNQAAHP
jgi:hypothetical protein